MPRITTCASAILPKSTCCSCTLIFSRHTEVVRVLLDNGAPVNQSFIDGQTSLMLAAEEGHIDIVKLLVRGPAFVCKHNSSRPRLSRDVISNRAPLSSTIAQSSNFNCPTAARLRPEPYLFPHVTLVFVCFLVMMHELTATTAPRIVCNYLLLQLRSLEQCVCYARDVNSRAPLRLQPHARTQRVPEWGIRRPQRARGRPIPCQLAHKM
jgi:ankyrin repeat protein